MFNPKSKIVGTTATHIRYLDDERNMAEELFRGNIASYMDLGTSIEKGIHKKPIYVSALYNIRAIIDDTQYKLERNNRATRTLIDLLVKWDKYSAIVESSYFYENINIDIKTITIDRFVNNYISL